MSGKRSTGINVGGSSILVIFILLCLTTFATLSMVSANADLKLTEKSAAVTRDYYAADAQAEETLALVDDYLVQQWVDSADSASFFVASEANFSQINTTLPVELERIDSDNSMIRSSMLLRYAVPMGEAHQLAVELRIVADNGGFYVTRNRWQVESTAPWQPDSQGMDFWDGTPISPDGLPPV